MESNDALAEIVRKYRSQAKYASAEGLHKARLSKVINGKLEPNERELEKLAKSFGLKFLYGLGQIAGRQESAITTPSE